MRFNIITNLNNGCGLQRDYEILRAELEALGHTVHGIQFNALAPRAADINLFLETVTPQIFHCAKEQWVIPNPEWWFPKYMDHLPSITKILCKTQDGLRLFSAFAKNKTQFLGFRSRDLFRPDVSRELRFLHVAGNSSVKNTEKILAAWASVPYHLTLITHVGPYFKIAEQMPHVEPRRKVSDEELTRLMNSCQFHLCPSKYEGFGHYLHEAQSVGALIITGDGPPMNEFGTPEDLQLPTTVESKLRLADMRGVSAEDIAAKATIAMTMPPTQIAMLSEQARSLYLLRDAQFSATLKELVGTC